MLVYSYPVPRSASMLSETSIILYILYLYSVSIAGDTRVPTVKSRKSPVYTGDCLLQDSEHWETL